MPDPGTARPDPVVVVMEGLLHGSVAAELAGVGSGAAAVRPRRSSGTAGPMAEEKERSGEGAMLVFLYSEVVGLHWSRRQKRHLGRRCRRLWRFGMEARSPGATRRACCEARSGINVLISKAVWARDAERGVVLASGCMDEGWP